MVSLNSGWFAYSSGVQLFVLLKVLQVDPGDYAFFTSIVGLGWYLKPFWGFLSDTFFVFGYR